MGEAQEMLIRHSYEMRLRLRKWRSAYDEGRDSSAAELLREAMSHATICTALRAVIEDETDHD